MPTIPFVYCDREYQTQQELNNAVTSQKSRLDNNPTDWCTVKEVTQNADGSWQMPPAQLDDADILNLDASKTYSFSTDITGEFSVGLSANEVSSKVDEVRLVYARLLRVNSVFVDVNWDQLGTEAVEEPTAQDMSGYITP